MLCLLIALPIASIDCARFDSDEKRWFKDTHVNSDTIALEVFGENPMRRTATGRAEPHFDGWLFIVCATVGLSLTIDSHFCAGEIAPRTAALQAKRAIAKVHIIRRLYQRDTNRAAMALTFQS